MNFLPKIIVLFSTIYLTYAGEFQIYSKPDYLSLASNLNSAPITVSTLFNNLATLFGLSSDQNEKPEVPLLFTSRPFDIPSTWLFHIEGFKPISNDGIAIDDSDEFAIESIHSKLGQTGHSSDLHTATIFINSESDLNGFGETLKMQMSQINEQVPIKYILIVCNECKTEKTIQQFNSQMKSAIDQLTKSQPKAFTLTLITKERTHERQTRQIDDKAANITIAPMYSDEYPTMFNLFFWTSLVLVIILISIAYVFLTLDPGSDTIIYRMTTTRAKID